MVLYWVYIAIVMVYNVRDNMCLKYYNHVVCDNNDEDSTMRTKKTNTRTSTSGVDCVTGMLCYNDYVMQYCQEWKRRRNEYQTPSVYMSANTLYRVYIL